MKAERRCEGCGAVMAADAPFGHCPKCLLQHAQSSKDASQTSGEAGVNSDLKPASHAGPNPPDPHKPGDRIGRYKLLEKIGEGGCGVVYMADQEEPVRRRVALKVIKAGMDTHEVIARFEAERQALALMDHPNIAKVFDGGATDTGRPYFVMELVRGIPITEYCDQKNSTTRQRLDLFMQVCQAVQHAHQKGIIHRDLKPSNILVTVNDGVAVPKVIDFGVAKATAQRLTDKTLFTRFQQLIGTPAYMSPEQAEMTSLDIDTRSDIYSLGVLLYELLTGRAPFDGRDLLALGFEQMLRTIREKEPVQPSVRLNILAQAEQTTVAQRRQTDPRRLVNLLRGDLDWIVMKCLEKDRTRRYETANGLGADIQRHLNSVPVLASPPGNLYRFQKTMRRHKLAFAAGGAVLASLVIGLGAATIMFMRELAERRSGDLARAEVVKKNNELERRNTEARAMLVEAARSDRLVAQDKLRSGQEQSAFAHLARACQYDPSSTLAAEMAVAALGSWSHELPITILEGHAKGVKSAQFSPDGKRVVTASFDKTACVWDVPTGRLLVTLAGHTGEVYSAEFSPDGTRIVTASDDKTARVWDPATGEMLVTLAGHDRAVVTAHFNPSGTRIVTKSVDKTARVWDARSGKALETLTGYERILITAQFSPDGTQIVTAGDITALVWDAATGKLLATLAGHKGDVRSARFNAEGTHIVTASWDGTARVWDAATGGVLATLASTGKALATLSGHQAGVWSAHFSLDSKHIVTASYDKTARIWNAITMQAIPEKPFGSIEFSSDGKRVATVSNDKTVRVWEIATGKGLSTLAGHTGRVWRAQFSVDGTRIITMSRQGPAHLWEAATGKALTTLAGPTGKVHVAEFSPDGTRIVTASTTEPARLWDATTGRMLATLAGHRGEVWNAQFSSDGKRVITRSHEGPARVLDVTTRETLGTLTNGQGWPHTPGKRIAFVYNYETVHVSDTATGKEVVTFAGNTGEVWRAQLSLDGTRLITTSDQEPARLWDVTTGKLVATFVGHTGEAWTMEFSPDGTLIVIVSNDQAARVWDTRSGKLVATFTGHTGEVRRTWFSLDGTRIITTLNEEPDRLWDATTGKELATFGSRRPVSSPEFSPDGRRIATAGGAVADLWDTATGEVLAKLTGHAGQVIGARFSRDGTRIVTTSYDQTVRVWDGTTGEPLAIVGRRDEGGLRSAQFNSDGTRIITTSNDGTVRFWDVLPKGASPPPEWFPDLLRYLAQMRLNSDGELERLGLADWFALRDRLRGVLRAGAGEDTPYLRILSRSVRE